MINNATIRDIQQRGKFMGTINLSIEDCQLLSTLLHRFKPKTILEIGSCNGTSSMLFGLYAQKRKGYVYCVEPIRRKQWVNNINHYGLANHVTMIVGESPWVDVNAIAEPIDMLFVNGKHSVMSVLVDFYFWQRYMRGNSIVAFHDWCGTRGHREAVRQALEILEGWAATNKQLSLAVIGTAECRCGGTRAYKIEKKK